MGLLACFHVQVQLRLSLYKRVMYPSLCMPFANAGIGRTHAAAAARPAKEEVNRTKNESQLLKQNQKEKTKITKRENGNSYNIPRAFHIHWEYIGRSYI